MKRFTVLFASFLAFLNTTVVFAEEVNYNPNSFHPIPYTEILTRIRVWRHINLLEKYNKPFFPHGKEITKFIIEGVKLNLLTAYSDEEFLYPMTQEEFLENLKIPETGNFSDIDDDDWGDSFQKKAPKQEDESDYFFPNEVSLLEIMEDWIFHKVRSEEICDIQSIKLIIPANKLETGLRRDVAIFKYKDLAAYFDEQKVVWHNVNNRAADIKMTEAFEQRLFSSMIVKLENPDNNTIADIYNDNPKDTARASKEMEEKLIERAYFLRNP